MFTLSSSAFKDGSVIPDKYAEENLISPPLKWENPPAGTECFAIVLLDQDIPGQFRDNLGRGFVHWMALVPATLSELAEGASPGNMPPVAFNSRPISLIWPYLDTATIMGDLGRRMHPIGTHSCCLH